MSELIILLYFIPVLIRTLKDWHVIEIKGSSINYREAYWTTAMLVLLVSDAISLVTSVFVLSAVLFSVSLYWILFDYLLNFLRRKPVFSYYGNFEDEANLSFIEKHIYKRIGWKWLLAMKIILFVTSIVIYG